MTYYYCKGDRLGHQSSYAYNSGSKGVKYYMYNIDTYFCYMYVYKYISIFRTLLNLNPIYHFCIYMKIATNFCDTSIKFRQHINQLYILNKR